MHGIALKYFVEVARTGSLSAASEGLHVAVSAISRQIAKLEEEVGAPLFERAPRGMVLSESGKLLLAHARRALLESETVLREIAGLQGSPRNQIRVACSEGPAQGFLPMAMAQFRQRWPDIRFDLHVSSPLEATRRVAEGEADVGMTFNVEQGKGVDVRHSRRAPVYAVMASAHPLADRAIVSLDDLRRYPLALTGAATTTRRLFELGCALDSVTIEPALSSNYSGALNVFVQQSNAIMLSGYVSVAWRLADGNLVAIPISNAELQSRTLQIQVMQDRLLPPAVEAFIAALAAELEQIATVP